LGFVHLLLLNRTIRAIKSEGAADVEKWENENERYKEDAGSLFKSRFGTADDCRGAE